MDETNNEKIEKKKLQYTRDLIWINYTTPLYFYLTLIGRFLIETTSPRPPAVLFFIVFFIVLISLIVIINPFSTKEILYESHILTVEEHKIRFLTYFSEFVEVIAFLAGSLLSFTNYSQLFLFLVVIFMPISFIMQLHFYTGIGVKYLVFFLILLYLIGSYFVFFTPMLTKVLGMSFLVILQCITAIIVIERNT